MQRKRMKSFVSKIRAASSAKIWLKPFLALAVLLIMSNNSASEATCRKEKMTWGSALMNHTYKTVHADNSVGCLLKCNEDPQCRSFNFWWNKLECAFNYAARYSAPTSFISQVNCVHRDMDSQPAKWFVDIPGEICMGSKDDTPGVFLTPMAGKISTLKLVYISGEVGCSRVLQLSSNWGADRGATCYMLSSQMTKIRLFSLRIIMAV
ncbi:hypothetical protein OS493_000121 [Desmophyllum pertusum]|uniref:Apple domain-containing protein n=1 Tax=Desmophyllum pertusum TaxID=174260 RepID=A0A9X0DD34_9CNID|nr:hypothetical protein OS493_000121 [Desmophyllum pertusum]